MADSSTPSSSDNPNLTQLSSLPEHILLHILSFLPTKMVVATSVLSKPWQHLWTLVPAIDLDDHGCRGRGTFEDMVSKVLDGNKAPIIRRFRLNGNFSTSSLDKWVSSATQRNVEELDLTVFDCGGDRRRGAFAFCFAPESRKTLVIMKLMMILHLKDEHLQFVIGGNLDFPALKVLDVNTVGFESQDPSLSGFFPTRFPLLEELVIKTGTHADINISLPILRRFKMRSFISKHVQKYTLTLEAPSLQYLVFRSAGSIGFRVEHLPNLIEANVDVFYNQYGKDEEYGESLIDFMNALADVRRLIVSLSTMQALRNASSNSSLHADGIQSFHNLVELDLQFHGSVLCITMIMLSKFKNLLHLKITEDGQYYEAENDLAPPAHVPNCLTYHLKTFCFQYFRGSEYGIEFAIYILKNSLVLENAKIRFDHHLNWTMGCHCHTILSTTSRGSSECRLEIEQISYTEYRDHKYSDYSDSD